MQKLTMKCQEHECRGTVNCSAGRKMNQSCNGQNNSIATGFWFSSEHDLTYKSKVYSTVGYVLGLGWN